MGTVQIVVPIYFFFYPSCFLIILINIEKKIFEVFKCIYFNDTFTVGNVGMLETIPLLLCEERDMQFMSW